MGPRIAIACSGLGHVQRGVEAWAFDLGHALRRAGADVTLFAGARMGGSEAEALRLLRRSGLGARLAGGALRPLGGWRLGLGSAYDVEQTSFSVGLWQEIRRDFDILHVQDPMIALWMERARRAGLSRPTVVYANGTGENASFMRRFRYLQLLTQDAAEAWSRQKPDGQSVFMIPNFIDTERFHPGDRAACRMRFGLPPGGTIILCCAAIRRFHKRIDVLLNEFAACCRGLGDDATLVIAGGRETETEALVAEGVALLGRQVCFLPDLPRHVMPDLYRTADAFVLPSLHEMFGIVLLEAMASGLPVVCHDTASFRSIVGPGGIYADLAAQGELARGLALVLQPELRVGLGQAARAQVVQRFSADAVTPAILDMYHSIPVG